MNLSPTVLIVEDELIAAENLKEFLQENGYNVLGKTDRGAKAVEMAQKFQPDLVLMDIMLKDGLSGSEAALKISRLCRSKIIFLTAYSEDEMLEYATQSHAAGYLIKPYNKTQVLTTLRLAIQYKNEQFESNLEPKKVMLADHYCFDTKSNLLRKNDKVIKLGSRARLLLSLLCQTPNKSVSNEQIALYIWGSDADGSLLRALVYRTRKVIGDRLIENISGTGYRIRTSDE